MAFPLFWNMSKIKVVSFTISFYAKTVSISLKIFFIKHKKDAVAATNAKQKNTYF